MHVNAELDSCSFIAVLLDPHSHLRFHNAQELLRACSSAAFLSTPSLYFSLPKVGFPMTAWGLLQLPQFVKQDASADF